MGKSEHEVDMSERKKIVVLATGGTIAGVGDAGKSTGYTPGEVGIEELTASVPLLNRVADVEARQVCNVNSDDITSELWFELLAAVREAIDRDDVDGVVVTHGTDTMDETAYFLDLLLATDKPVVVTGSMRPSTAISPDGPMNLYQAAVVATAPESWGRGVLVVFSNGIYAARDVQKLSTHSVTAFSGGERGSLGVVRDSAVFYHLPATRKHYPRFDLGAVRTLPKVAVLYFTIDLDPRLVEAMAQLFDGIVVAGAGAGEMSHLVAAAFERVSVPVVVSSRTGHGGIAHDALPFAGAISASDLPPQKAVVLLRVALAAGVARAELPALFFRC